MVSPDPLEYLRVPLIVNEYHSLHAVGHHKNIFVIYFPLSSQ